MKKQFLKNYNDIISIENLLSAWHEFLSGKKKKSDVQNFQYHLMDTIILLHDELANGSYEHSGYESFHITVPKPRNIHKASVKDRLLHHAIYRQLYPFFDKTFISDSFSCRLNKGTHKALKKFQEMGGAVSKNNTKTCWILKCDIKKFFASVDQNILIQILHEYICDNDIIILLEKVIKSFAITPGKGLPLGNLTSQLFANVYMNVFDQYIKHNLRIKHYIRYADDFVIFSENRQWLPELIMPIRTFLQERLRLTLHPQKMYLNTLSSGMDFLGWVHFFHHRVLRKATEKRMIQRVANHLMPETLQSYLGLLGHGNAFKLKEEILKCYRFMGFQICHIRKH